MGLEMGTSAAIRDGLETPSPGVHVDLANGHHQQATGSRGGILSVPPGAGLSPESAMFSHNFRARLSNRRDVSFDPSYSPLVRQLTSPRRQVCQACPAHGITAASSSTVRFV